jgi:cell division septal protein FtsQ
MSGRSATTSRRTGGPRGAHPAIPEAASSRTSGSQAHARPRRRARSRARTRAPLLGAGRLLAVVLAAALVAALLWLLNGPWLRIGSVGWAGTRYTSDQQVAKLLEPLKGSSLLTLDDAALAARLTSLPPVRAASVDPTLPGGIAVRLQEKAPTLVWQTAAGRLVIAADGVIFGDLAFSQTLPSELTRVPFVVDRRADSREFAVGEAVPEPERSIALRLTSLNPAALGSSAKSLQVRIDDRCGFVISPRSGPDWAAAIGLYAMEAGSTGTTARLEAQITAIRTLFAAHRESTIGWVDARNPGKVYWRPIGSGGSGAC